MKLFEDVEERVKKYEDASNLHRCPPNQPIIARIQGRGLLTHLKNCNLIGDPRLPMIFDRVCERLFNRVDCDLAHHRLDEILLVWNYQDKSNQCWLDGNIQRMCSVIASQATNLVTRTAMEFGVDNLHAIFECHIWTVPSLVDAADVMFWQEVDSRTFNKSILWLASMRYNGDDLNGKSLSHVLDMLSQDGVVVDYRTRRGTYIRKVLFRRPFTADELMELPDYKRTRARLDPKFMHLSTGFTKLRIKALSTYTIDERIAILFGKLERKLGDSE